MVENIDVDFWEWWLESRTGVFLDGRLRHVEASVRNRMHKLDIEDEAEYRNLATNEHSSLEAMFLIDSLVVNDTRFYRHLPSFDWLRKQAIEQLMQPAPSDFSVLSAGCSTGEEAWSMAMLLEPLFATQEHYFDIVGADINRHALRTARKGCYLKSKLRLLDDQTRSRYFEQHSDFDMRITDSLRQRVAFVYDNMLLGSSVDTHFDVIFCQNVLVYFRRWRRRDVVNRLVKLLKPGGSILLAPGELDNYCHPELERITAAGVSGFTKSRLEG